MLYIYWKFLVMKNSKTEKAETSFHNSSEDRRRSNLERREIKRVYTRWYNNLQGELNSSDKNSNNLPSTVQREETILRMKRRTPATEDQVSSLSRAASISHSSNRQELKIVRCNDKVLKQCTRRQRKKVKTEKKAGTDSPITALSMATRSPLPTRCIEICTYNHLAPFSNRLRKMIE